MTRSEINRREWENAANWRGGWLGIYKSARDSRILVPKRNPIMGWTFNVGHPLGLALTIGIPTVMLVLTLRAVLTEDGE